MATVPLSGTNIRLLSGIPFFNDYQHTRWFDTIEQQNTYFNSQNTVHSISEYNFQRIDGFYFIAVNKSIDDLWNVNYLMFQNAQYNNKWFYAFVTKLEYKQRNNTHVHFQIDVLQTWRFDFNFRPSFVVREHCKLWNDDGTPVINTVDEGLNYGLEYETVSVQKYLPYQDMFFLVMVAKKRMDNDEVYGGNYAPTTNGVPQPLVYYFHPFKTDGTVPNIMLDQEGAPLSPILDVVKAVAKSEDAVNNVVAMYVTDFTGLSMGYDASYDEWNMSRNNVSLAIINDGSGGTITTLQAFDIKQYSTTDVSFGNIYADFKTVYESKLLMSPYCYTILDDFKGNRITLRNEYLKNNNLTITVLGSIGTSNRVVYAVTNYLRDVSIPTELSKIMGLENAIINNSPNDLPILNDYLSAFLQGNRNSLENQANSVLFNGITNLLGNATNPLGMVSSGGNSLLEIQGMSAKIKDIDNVPPTLAKLGSNTYFDYGNGINGIHIIKKQITSEYRKKLEDFFNMFGYKVNEVKIPNLHTRVSWNYVKTSSCTLSASLNHDDLSELRNIFDNGITLWHIDEIGNYAIENGVI